MSKLTTTHLLEFHSKAFGHKDLVTQKAINLWILSQDRGNFGGFASNGRDAKEASEVPVTLDFLI